FAIKMEKDGEHYYRQLASMASNAGFKKIFTMLADAEVVHQAVFRKMKDNDKVKVSRTNILAGVKNIFEAMREDKDSGDGNIIQTELYKKARELERQSRDFYLEYAKKVKDEGQKETFLKIADEEKKHYFILEEIIDFVSRPQTWLENPEWYHIEEY
ncbi:MAG TPA: ferritin family protein, partial [Thermodesulfovibrionales bacterium]|nr:ferritin family protein [Thermodesulfovibrionales bacterium]